jgi:hypothetical protein
MDGPTLMKVRLNRCAVRSSTSLDEAVVIACCLVAVEQNDPRLRLGDAHYRRCRDAALRAPSVTYPSVECSRRADCSMSSGIL